jgi:hypothetical protein
MMHHLLKRLLPFGRSRRLTSRLAVEQLEDRCLLSSTLQAISVPGSGQLPSDTAAGSSFLPAVSTDGRVVVFESSATNLVPGQTGGAGPNVFLLDRTTGLVTLVSHLPGAPTTGTTLFFPTPSQPFLSRDGRYVVYLAGNDVIGQGITGPFGTISIGTSVVVYDRLTGLNTLVSHTNSSPTTPTFFTPNLDAVSGNGRYIVFDTEDTNMVPNEVVNGGAENLYLYDQVLQATFLITHVDGQTSAAAGYSGAAFGRGVTVADNGTVAYLDTGNTLVNGQTGFSIDNVYLYQPATQTNRLISAVAGSPLEATGLCGSPVLSEDGSALVFVSKASNLVNGQNTELLQENVFRYNVTSQTMTLLSGTAGSTTTGGNADSGIVDSSTSPAAVNPDGRFIAFVSQATDLVPSQSGAAGNLFLYDALAGSLTLLTGVNGSATVGAGGDATLLPPGAPSSFTDPISQTDSAAIVSLSDNGGLVAFVSQANNLVPGQTGPTGIDNIFLYSKTSGGTRLVTGIRGSATAGDLGESGVPVLSGDGSVLAFHSLDFDLGSGFLDANGVADVFTYDTTSQTVAVVSRAGFAQVSPGNNYSTSVSADGHSTVFTSTAENLVSSQVTVNTNQNIFLYQAPTDTTPATISLVNHIPNFPATTGDGGVAFTFGQRPDATELPVISADGSTVAFVSTDDNLVPGEPPGSALHSESLVYLYDVASGTVRLVNHLPGQPNMPNLVAQQPVVSFTGRYVAYVFGFSTPGPSGFGQGAIALYDSVTDQTTLITSLDANNEGTASSPSISDNGRYVTYLNQGNVYVYDSNSRQSTLVSHDVGSSTTAANGASSAPVISHDGSTVAFVSAATDLVNNQAASSFTNVFEYNISSGTVSLVSGVAGSGSVGGNGNSDSPALDADGGYLAYRSDASNLVPGQSGSGSNIYELDRQAGAQTLVSHQAGAPQTTADGTSSAPVIDDDGHLVSYVSTADNLIPGQSGLSGVENVFLWLRQTDANILASGQDGSPTITGNADSDGPLLTRHSYPGFSSKATNLVQGVGGTSVAYINTLVQVSLSPNSVRDGSAPGALVGMLSISTLIVGQYLPPLYHLAPASQTTFSLTTNGSGTSLFTRFPASYATQQTYLVTVHVDVGLGDSVATLQVFVAAASNNNSNNNNNNNNNNNSTNTSSDRISAKLVWVTVGKKKKTRRLMAEVSLAGGAKKDIASPFQGPAYKNIQVSMVDSNGDGILDEVVFTARKGKKKVSKAFHV